MGDRVGAPTADNGNVGLGHGPHTDEGVVPIQVWRMEVYLNQCDEADNRHDYDTGTPSATYTVSTLSEMITYKLPRMKIPASAIFWARVLCSFQITGIDNERIATSVTMLGTALPIKKA